MMSEATEILDTDFEDDSDYERAGSFESVSGSWIGELGLY